MDYQEIGLETQEFRFPATRESFSQVEPQMSQQFKAFQRIVSGLKTGNLTPPDLSLGVDTKIGRGSFMEEVYQRDASRIKTDIIKALRSKNVMAGVCPDSYSLELWKERWKKVFGVHPSWPFSRVLLSCGGLVNEDYRPNESLQDNLANILTAIRLTGMPLNFKFKSYYDVVLYGRDINDAILQALAIFNFRSPNGLIQNLQPIFDSDEELIERYFHMVPFPGFPFYDEYSFPIDPCLSFRDRISHLGSQDPVGTYKALKLPGTALQLGRMGASAQAVIDLTPRHTKTKTYGYLDTVVEKPLELYKQRGLDALKQQGLKVFTLTSRNDSTTTRRMKPGEVQGDKEILDMIDDKTLILFRPKDSVDNNLYAFIVWQERNSINPHRFLFVYKINQQDNPHVFKACHSALNNVS